MNILWVLVLFDSIKILETSFKNIENLNRFLTNPILLSRATSTAICVIYLLLKRAIFLRARAITNWIYKKKFQL